MFSQRLCYSIRANDRTSRLAPTRPFRHQSLTSSSIPPPMRSASPFAEKSSSPSSLREDTSALTNKAPEDLVVASNNKSTSPSKRKSDVATTALRSFIGSISRANDPGGSGMKGVFKEQAKNLASTMKTLKEQVRKRTIPWVSCFCHC